MLFFHYFSYCYIYHINNACFGCGVVEGLRKGVLSVIDNTPLIRIKSLYKFTGCEVKVNANLVECLKFGLGLIESECSLD